MAKLKAPWRDSLGDLQQRLILTAGEKRVVTFVLAAFVLGLGVKHYRETHPGVVAHEAVLPAQKTKKLQHKHAQPATPTPNSGKVAED